MTLAVVDHQHRVEEPRFVPNHHPPTNRAEALAYRHWVVALVNCADYAGRLERLRRADSTAAKLHDARLKLIGSATPLERCKAREVVRYWRGRAANMKPAQAAEVVELCDGWEYWHGASDAWAEAYELLKEAGAVGS